MVTATRNIEPLLERLNLKVRSWHELPRSRQELSPPYRIDAEQGTFFLKLERPAEEGRRALQRTLLGSPTLRRQIAVYEGLQAKSFTHLRFPKLVQTDHERFMLLEYIPQADAPTRAGILNSEAYRQALIHSLIEFQTSGITLEQRDLGAYLLDKLLDPALTVLRWTLAGVRKRWGLGIARQYQQVLASCIRAQAPLNRPVLLHNDFHLNNVLIGPHEVLYLGDFEKVTSNTRWLLLDMVHYAVDTHTPFIDLGLIRQYVTALNDYGFSMHELDLRAQLRFALLKRLLQHLFSKAPPKEVKEHYETMLRTVLLPEGAYVQWYEQHAALQQAV